MDSTTALLQYSTDNQFHYQQQYSSYSPFTGNNLNRTRPANRISSTQTNAHGRGLLRSSTLPVLEKKQGSSVINGSCGGGTVFLNPPPISSLTRPLYPIQPQQPPLLPLPPMAVFKSIHHQSLPPTGRQSSPPPPPAQKKQQINNKKKPSKRSSSDSKTSSNPTTTNTIDVNTDFSGAATPPARSAKRAGPRTNIISDKGFAHREVMMAEFLLDDASVFAVSPPPSSLPLPKFSLRPKKLISCNLEAAAGSSGAVVVDAAGAATDSICRILNLR